MKSWVIEKITQMIHNLPQKEIAEEFKNNLTKNNISLFLKNKKYYAYIEVLCMQYNRENNLDIVIDKNLLTEILKEVKSSF